VIPAGREPLFDVPDLPTAVVAWRVWRLVPVDRAYRLASAFIRAIWLPGEPLTAECLAAASPLALLLRKPRHDAPSAGCNCGVYGTDLTLMDGCLSALRNYRALGLVVGEVSLWGTVVECEHGFRAAHAYPKRLYFPADANHGRSEEVARDLSAYRVPLEVLPVGCAGAAKELRERIAA
jgi:hypothetical protein